MTTLYPAAREDIHLAGLTVAAYIRHFSDDGKWHGDRCGCSDDRCIGNHHEPYEVCGCLPVLIGVALAAIDGAAVTA